jgi:DNA-binding NtrC family response regulator
MDSTQFTHTLSASTAKPLKAQIHAWTVEVVSGPDKGNKVTTLDALMRVGSDPASDLVLSDPTVSRTHAELERTPRGLLIRDLGSRNGTWIGNRQVLGAFLEPGDTVTLGKTRLKVRQEAKPTEVALDGAERFGDLVGTSDAMRRVFAELRQLSGEEVSVLLEGETGTGKELAARGLHALSARRNGPFTVIDCNLLGADADKLLFGEAAPAEDAEGGGPRPGALAAARGGTLFLDEVGDLPPEVQPKLLRVLETRELPRVGGAPEPLDVRIVAATQKNLDEEIRQDRFRKDLYFRLAVAKVRLPPLRCRHEDLPVLVRHLSRGQPSLSAQALTLLERYDWPGNVRELRNLLERGAILGDGEGWTSLLPAGRTPDRDAATRALAKLSYHEAKDRIVADFERVYFTEVMREHEFDLARAERHTGLSIQSLYRLLKKNGLRLKDLKNTGDLDR